MTAVLTSRWARLEAATAHLDPPYAVLDLDALRANTADLLRRAAGTPIRVASKSVRCREVLREVLATDGFHGVLAYTLPEALWLAATDAFDDRFADIVIGYPTADRDALRRLAADERLAARVTLMVDSTDQLDIVDAAVGMHRPDLRVCLDLDASLRLLGGRVHLGPRRSPAHDPAQVRTLARAVLARPGFRLVGIMSYEGQIAGLGDDVPGNPVRRAILREVQRRSAAELARRRAAAVAAVRELTPLEFVNGGGTGSIELTVAEEAVTEVAAGSGLYAPTLFDNYRAFDPEPAAFFALSVVRRPARRIVTVLGGGWIASGPTGADRSPTPVWPEGLTMLGAEGAGEVQTPLTGRSARDLRVGDRVWFRHTKAGELCEHVDGLHRVAGDRITDTVPTYRGEGMTFL